jgi:hypothetical protein
MGDTVDLGLRYDEGKVRMDRLDPRLLVMIGEIMTECPECRRDLIPKSMLLELGMVYSKGAMKYSDRNWEKGMAYSRIIGPVYRHLMKWLMGERLDKELGTHHLAHVIFNLAALIEFEKTHPEKDDRDTKTMTLGDGK